MTERNVKILAAISAIALIISIASIAYSAGVISPKGGVGQLQPTKRIIYMSAVEYKGSADALKENFPSKPLPAGKGYELEKKDGTWVVETYRFESSAITVFQGDEVTLNILGVNGDKHNVIIQKYLENAAVLKRGELLTINFKADTIGSFPIICTIHQPTMLAYLVVLPRP